MATVTPSTGSMLIRNLAATSVRSGNYGTPITNSNAATDDLTNYQMCDITGFKVPVDEPFVDDWRGRLTRKKSVSEKHPQESVKGKIENPAGSLSPEPEAVFVDEAYPNGVSADDDLNFRS
jgi:hypothetical protein